MKKAVITWGRMNPPTIGHQKLVSVIQTRARAEGADAHVYLSHTQDSKSNPLSYKDKIEIAIKAFGRIVKRSAGIKTIDKVLESLGKRQGYDEVILIVGSDRVNDFKKLETYRGRFGLKKLTVTSDPALARDPDADDASGMSASKARKLAYEGDFQQFDQAMPNSLSETQTKSIYLKIRRAIGKKRKVVLKEPTPDKPRALSKPEKKASAGTNKRISLFNPDGTLAENESQLSERIVSFKQRRAMARTMKRLAPRMKRRREQLKKRLADAPHLEKRARKQAKQMVRDRFAGARGKDYSNLNRQAKIAVDKQIDGKSKMIAAFAKRLLPKVRKAEMQRLVKQRKANQQNEEVLNEIFMPGIAETIFANDLPELNIRPNFKIRPTVEIEEEEEALEIGTDKLRDHYTDGTPGQSKLDVIKKILDL